jgi:predicted DsbA family dithiol-disulfide isomerase
MARQLQLDGVPYFIFNEQYAVAGAHLSEHFLPVIDAATA